MMYMFQLTVYDLVYHILESTHVVPSLIMLYFTSIDFYFILKCRASLISTIFDVQMEDIMKKIKLIAMGGTISAWGNSRTDLKDYRSGILTGSDFLQPIPELHQIADLTIEQFDNVSSTEINTTHWIQLRNRIQVLLTEDEYDGIVITQGTNTLEETAYYMHLTVPSEKPIVLAGSQRPFSALSSDAPLNLIHAIRVAVADESHGKGVLVIANDEINGAREVTKTDTYRLETFQSGKNGFLGFVDPDNTIQYYRAPTRKHTLHSIFSNLDLENPLPNIEIVYSYAGATGELIEHIARCGKYQGLIIAGTGAGRFSKAEENALIKAKEAGLHIVRSSRVGSGRVLDIDHYKELQAISGDNLLPQKARILLMLSLLVHNQVEDIQTIFNHY